VTSDAGFEDFYKAEYRAVYRTIYLLSRDRAAAEDATQEAFVRALERWARLRDKAWAGGWVTSTAMNLARRGLRRRVFAAPSQAGADPDVTLDLWQQVGRLPRRQQQALVLHHRFGLSIEEAARAMGVAESTARVHLGRARDTLRTALKEVSDA